MASGVFQGYSTVNIKSLTIQSVSSGKTVDITSIVSGMEFYGSIFSPTWSGSIQLYDGSGLIQSLPLIGEEVLNIEFSTQNRQSFQRSMHIFFPEEQAYDPNGSHIHNTLHFTSLDHFPGATNTISQGYTQNISDIVPGIIAKYVGSTLKVNVEPTKGIENIVIPRWSPWHALETLRSRAVSQQYFSPYVFFQDQNGYNFMSYEYLIKQRQHTAADLTFTSDSFLPGAGDPGKKGRTVLPAQYRNVADLTIDEKSNVMKMAHDGGLSSSSVVFDFVNKKTKRINVNYTDAASIIKQPLGKYFPTHSSFVNAPKGAGTISTYLLPFDENNPSALPDIYNKKKFYINQLTEIKIGFTTPGDSQMQPGDIIQMNMPATVNNPQPDQHYTGQYLISRLRHGITGSNMYTTVEAYRCGFPTKVV